jgi:hypothetical protein
MREERILTGKREEKRKVKKQRKRYGRDMTDEIKGKRWGKREEKKASKKIWKR